MSIVKVYTDNNSHAYEMNSKCGFLTKLLVDDRWLPGGSFSMVVKGVGTPLPADAF